jgi:hypothetical protein
MYRVIEEIICKEKSEETIFRFTTFQELELLHAYLSSN